MDYDLTDNEERIAIMAIERFISDCVVRARQERTIPHRRILEEQTETAEVVLHKIEAARLVQDA